MVGYNLLNAYGPKGEALFIEVPWAHEENELRILAAVDVEEKFKLRLLGTDSYTRVGDVIAVPYPFDEPGIPWRLFIWRVTEVNEKVTFDGVRIPVEGIVAKLNELSEKVEEAQLLYRRAVKAPEDMDGHMILPTEKVRAGKVLGFDESGLPLSGLEYIPETKEFLDKIRKLTEDSLAELEEVEKSVRAELEKFVDEDLRARAEEVCDSVMKENLDASEAAKDAAESAAESTKTYNQGAWEAYSKALDTLESVKDLRARCETIYAEISKYRYEVLTRDEYNAKVAAGTTKDDVLYFVKGSVDVGALVEKWNDAGMSEVPEKLDAEITRSTKADEDLGANIVEVGKEVEKVKTKLTSAMHYKGSVATKDLLPVEAHEPGDVWNVLEDGKNYAWDGTAWDDISGVMSIPQATTTTLGGVKLFSSTVGSTTGTAGVQLTATGCMVVPQATTTTAGVGKLGTAGQVPNNGGMVGLTSNGSFGLNFATESTGGSVRVGGNGIGISSGVLNLKLRTQYSGLEFDNKALFVNCADETSHPAAADSASVATNTDGKLCVPLATTSANGAVKIASSVSDTGASSVLIASQVKTLLAQKASASDLTALTGRVTTLESSVDGLDEAIRQTTAAVFALSTTVAGKQDKLTAGDNITIVDGVISATGGGTVDAYTKAETDTLLDAKVNKSDSSVAIGRRATASGTTTTAIGQDSAATGNDSVALGNGATATKTASTALGYGSTADGMTSVAVGYVAMANHDSSIVLSAKENAVSAGANTFNAFFGGGVAGFYIDGTSLGGLLDAKAAATDVATLSGRVEYLENENTQLPKLFEYQTNRDGWQRLIGVENHENDNQYTLLADKGTGEIGFGYDVGETSQGAGIAFAKVSGSPRLFLYDNNTKYAFSDILSDIAALKNSVAVKADTKDVNTLRGQLGGFSIRAMCQEAYDELVEKDSYTMYYIIEESILTFKLRDDVASYEVCPPGGYGTALNDCVFGDVVIPSTYKGKPVTCLYYYAFGNTTRLKSVVIPDSVTELTVSSFQNSSIVSVTIPSSITVLPDSLFCSCKNLASITIPSSVKEVDGYAFYNCTSLAYCKFEGNAPTIVGENQFEGCSALTEIHVNTGTTGWGDTWCGKTVVVDVA